MAGSEVIDGLSAPFAHASGIPVEDWTTSIGDEMLALGLEVPAGFIFPTLGRTIVYAIAGFAFLAARATAYKSGRPAKDTEEFAGHFFNRSIVLVTDPLTAGDFAAGVAALKTGSTTGLIRTPTDIQNLVNQVIGNWQAVIGLAGGSVSGFRPSGQPVLVQPSITAPISAGSPYPGVGGVNGGGAGGGVIY